MAEALGVSQPTVSRWRVLPARYAREIEQLTGISRHDLAPDYYPREDMVDRGTSDRIIGVDLETRGRQFVKAMQA